MPASPGRLNSNRILCRHDRDAQGTRTVRPSMRPVAAWLALWRDTVFDDVVALDPAVVLDYGDPQSLRPAQRIKALAAYVARYSVGGWRGLSTPSMQVHRFASLELTQSVARLWAGMIENPEVRYLLLQIVGAGKLQGCADIRYAVAMDEARNVRERSLAIRALVQLDSPRLDAIAASVETDVALWPTATASWAAIDMFPGHISVSRFLKILRRVKDSSRSCRVVLGVRSATWIASS